MFHTDHARFLLAVSLVVIAFEMTGSTPSCLCRANDSISPPPPQVLTADRLYGRVDVDYIFPIVLAVLVSKWVANAFGRNGMCASPLA